MDRSFNKNLPRSSYERHAVPSAQSYERRLKICEARFHSLLALLPQIAWLAEVDGSVSHFNSRWYEYTGLTPVESQGWGLLTAVHPEDRIFFVDENYWTHSVECRIQGADGIYRWFSLQRMPVKGVGDEILEWVGTFTLKEPVAQSDGEYLTQGTGAEDAQNPSEQIQDTPEARNVSGNFFNLSTASPLLWASKDVSAQPLFEISSHSIVPTAYSDRQRGKLPIQEQAVGHPLNLASQPQRTLDAKLSRAIVWEADATTPEFTFVSPSAEDILGYPVEQWLDQPDFWVNLIHPEDRQWTVALCRKRMVQGRDYELEYRCLAADKRVVWLRDRAFVVRDDQGQAYKRRGLMVDITPAKQAEIELQTSIHFWSAIAQLTQQVLSRIPISTLIDEAASLVAQTLGIEYCQVWEWLPDDKMLKLQAGVGWRNGVVGNLAIDVNPHTQIGYTLQSGQPAVVEDWNSETRFEHFPLLEEHHIASGMSVMMAGKSNPHPSNSGEVNTLAHPFGVLAVYSSKRRVYSNSEIDFIQSVANILAVAIQGQRTAQALYEVKAILAQTTAALEKRNKEIDQFTYIASHDLRAPLRAIANLSQWIEEDISDQLNEENLHQMQLLRGRVCRLEALIEGLLQYSRAGRLKREPELVDVKALLLHIINTLHPPAQFTIEIAPEMPTLVTERLPLEQVFTHLIDNAIKHHPSTQGSVKIGVREQSDVYEFSVTDDGAGIAPQFHGRIFVIFQTLHARDVVENMGVGLPIVKKIVEANKGTVRVDSQEGQGATFFFSWPKL